MTAPRCPICGEIFELKDDEADRKKAKRTRDIHVDWCEDVERARKRIALGFPAPGTCTPDMIEAARDRIPDDDSPVQTVVNDW